MENNLKEVRERVYFNKSTLKDIEFDILNRRHIERYALIRQYLYGDVLDVSCGSGYGSYLVSNNPDINSVLGLDISKEGIDWAKANFETEKVKFLQKRIEDHTSKADVLVSIETIEHLENPHILNDLAERCQVDQILVSYPSKKTTRYNAFHFSDFIDDEIIRIFSNFKLVDVIDLHRECRILKLQRYDSSL